VGLGVGLTVIVGVADRTITPLDHMLTLYFFFITIFYFPSAFYEAFAKK
jgi:hypothetical protein